MPIKTLPVLALLGLFACSLDYGPEMAQSLDQTPEIVLEGLEWTSVEDGEKVYVLRSEKAEQYTDLREYRMVHGSFQEFGPGGQVKTEGSAGSAKVNQDSNDAALEDTVKVRSETEKTTLEATSLQWSDQRKFLSSPPDQKVKVIQDESSVMEGTGFSLDLKTKTLQFTRGVSGIYTQETQETQSQTTAPLKSAAQRRYEWGVRP